MSARIEFFPVGNGDMTLVTLETGRTILIDCNIRGAADDTDDEDTPDVGQSLRDRLERDASDRLFVDAFLLSHPDKDHCTGLVNHFHLGAAEDWKQKDDKILIREMWSSPIVFRRKKRTDKLCPDAEAWRDEARRRVNLFKDGGGDDDGDRILVLGHDVDHKTDDIDEILFVPGEEIETIAGEVDGTFVATLLGPLEYHEDEDEEELLAKNRSSVIMQLQIAADGVADACLFLTGGDAEVAIWERIWQNNKDEASVLSYDVLQTPHHCSWHSLSHDSWSDKRTKGVISEDARSALSQTREAAMIIASCNPILDDDCDPPCYGAGQEYERIAEAADGSFTCVADHIEDTGDEVLLIKIGKDGVTRASGGSSSASGLGISSGPRKTEKRGGGRYAGRFA